jgi:hypothetical protein
MVKSILVWRNWFGKLCHSAFCEKKMNAFNRSHGANQQILLRPTKSASQLKGSLYLGAASGSAVIPKAIGIHECQAKKFYTK